MEGGNALAQRIGKFLKPEETIIFVQEAVYILDGKKKPVVLVLARHEPTPEQALFLFSPESPSLPLVDAIPFFEDLRMTVRDGFIELFSQPRRERYQIELSGSDAVSSVRASLSKALHDAQQESYCVDGKSHDWLLSYKDQRAGSAGRNELTESSSNPLVSFAKKKNGGEYDPSKFMSIKEVWVNGQMNERAAEFTDMKTIRVFLGTWNVNGRKPEDALDPWLRTDPPPDIFAIGFQELDLSAQALVLGDTTKSEPWEEAIIATLSTMDDYILLMTKQNVGILLVVCVKPEHLPYIHSVQTAAASVGIMGIMGNKGGVAIRFSFHDSTFCFVNSHLNAHYERVQRRNQDYKDICHKIIFQNDSTIFDHEHLFWIGDLNYRIELPNTVVRKKIQEQDYAYLLERDQLKLQVQKQLAFEEFAEGPITFAPSYKYDPGTDRYDTSEKRRTPAWCDRILWKTTAPASHIRQLTYARHELLSSDHRPVSSLMLVQVKSIIPEKRNAVYQDIVKKLDKMENECIPDAAISSNNVFFPNVKYLIPSEQTIQVQNTGKVVVRFRFIPKLNQKKFSKAWLDVRPPFGMVMPGETVPIKLTVLINNSWAPDFNLGREKFEDILIMHLEKGKDYFITVSGNYIQSCFGSTLEHLVCFPCPIASAPRLPPSSDRLSIPKELWRIVDYIYKRGMDERGLFSQSGIQSEMEQIRELLDNGRSFDEYSGSIHSMAESLYRFLESLAEPVIPVSLYKQCLDNSGSYAQCKQLLSYLPSVNYNVFYYLMAFLRELLLHAAQNKVTPEKLALLFSNVLIRSPNVRSANEQNQERKKEFILHFLSKEKLKVP
jgi:phosphatidylinositol-bisphosphatase